jgi:predicted alpha/beta hydrolase
MTAAMRQLWRWRFNEPFRGREESLWVRADDGVRLCLSRLRPVGPPRAAAILVHGLGANRFALHNPRRSFAEHLAAKGFDCFVVELRGAGASDRPTRPWDLDDYLDLDLPAVIDAVSREAKGLPLHWIGHSLGGVMLMLYGMRHPEDSGIARGVAVGSALEYAQVGSGFEAMLPARRLVERLSRIPFGTFTHLVAPALGRLGNPIEGFNVWSSNVEPQLIRRLHANGFEDIQVSLLRSLITAFEGGLRSRDGSIRYRDLFMKLRIPTLIIGGSEDRQCPPAAIAATLSQLPATVEKRMFGKAHGQVDDYGHVDLLIGRRAETEVWPHLVEWLSRT